jgi:hypothetical protein
VVSVTPQPHFTPRKRTPEQKSFASAEDWTLVVQSVVGHYTDWITVHTTVINSLLYLTVKLMFRAVFWVILPCKMIVDRRFRGAYCLHHQGFILVRRFTLFIAVADNVQFKLVGSFFMSVS